MGDTKQDSGDVRNLREFGYIINKSLDLGETIYGIPVILFVGSPDKYREYIKDEFNMEDEVIKSGFAGESNLFENKTVIPFHYVSLIWLNKFVWNVSCYETLGHEILHTAYSILNIAGIKVNYKNHEPLTYLWSWIYRQALYRLRELDNKEIAKRRKLKKRKK